MTFLINPYRFGVTDPNFSSVSLLLHGDGANGSTTITDSSGSPKTVTAFGNAAISTAQSKFGGASIAFDGNGDYLSAGTNTDYDFPGDFTIESWCYLTSWPASAGVILDARSQDNLESYVLSINATGKLDFIYSSSRVTSSGSLATGSWHYIAAKRAGSTITLHVNATQDGSASFSGAINSSAVLAIGGGRSTGGSSAINGYYLNGYIDELRITKGVARDVSTVPTAPFPTS
jgi:hypothetical protein